MADDLFGMGTMEGSPHCGALSDSRHVVRGIAEQLESLPMDVLPARGLQRRGGPEVGDAEELLVEAAAGLRSPLEFRVKTLTN